MWHCINFHLYSTIFLSILHSNITIYIYILYSIVLIEFQEGTWVSSLLLVLHWKPFFFLLLLLLLLLRFVFCDSKNTLGIVLFNKFHCWWCKTFYIIIIISLKLYVGIVPIMILNSRYLYNLFDLKLLIYINF